jgi:hypothetical protein
LVCRITGGFAPCIDYGHLAVAPWQCTSFALDKEDLGVLFEEDNGPVSLPAQRWPTSNAMHARALG